MAFCAVRPIEQAKVYSPTPAHRKAYAREVEELLGITVEPVDDPRKAVEGTDILATCTNSMEPVVFADMLEPGMHLTSVSGTELAGDVAAKIDVVMGGGQRRDTLFQGKLQGAGGGAALTYTALNEQELDEVRETSGLRYGEAPRSSEPLKVRRVSHEELVAGAPGRLNDAEISSSTGVGGGGDGVGGQGIAFVTVGRLVYDLAKEHGLGTVLPTEMFLQDIRD
jgi:alanine dehydrogenase